jgi:hypothetical protein
VPLDRDTKRAIFAELEMHQPAPGDPRWSVLSWERRRLAGGRDERVASIRRGCRYDRAGYFFKSSRKRVLRLISAGERPADSSQFSKSRTRTTCSTSGCLTMTLILVRPRPMSPAQSASRNALRPCATASYRLSAVTSMVCSTPSMSRQVTLHVRSATRGK